MGQLDQTTSQIQSILNSVNALKQTLVVSGGVTTIDLDLGGMMILNLTGNTVVNLPAVLGPYHTFQIIVRQDGVGNRTLTWDPAIRWPGKVAPQYSLTANSEDIFSFSIYPDGVGGYRVYGVPAFNFGVVP